MELLKHSDTASCNAGITPLFLALPYAVLLLSELYSCTSMG